jgi:leucyl-tRNA synthetase
MAPAVPHITAELWAHRHPGAHIHTEAWPVADPDRLVVVRVTMVIQVNGRVRDRLEVDPGISETRGPGCRPGL